jgi:hypothetical protein
MQVSSNHSSQERPSKANSYRYSLLESKKRSRKSNKSCKPLLCLRSCLGSSNELRPEPRGVFGIYRHKPFPIGRPAFSAFIQAIRRVIRPSSLLPASASWLPGSLVPAGPASYVLLVLRRPALLQLLLLLLLLLLLTATRLERWAGAAGGGGPCTCIVPCALAVGCASEVTRLSRLATHAPPATRDLPRHRHAPHDATPHTTWPHRPPATRHPPGEALHSTLGTRHSPSPPPATTCHLVASGQ